MKKLFTILLSTSILFISCSNETGVTNSATPANDDATVKADLEKIASSVASFAIGTQDNPDENSAFKTPVSTIDDYCSTTKPEVDTFTIDDVVYTDSTEYYDLDGARISICDLDSSYISKSIQHSKGDKFETHMTMEDTTTFSGSYTDSDFSMTMSASLSGTVNYYNDDLLIEIVQGYVTMKDMVSKIYYDMRIMDGKYTVIFDQTMEMDMIELDENNNGTSDKADEPVTVEISGPITDTNGVNVGTFQVMSDDSVVILDVKGDIVKNTND